MSRQHIKYSVRELTTKTTKPRLLVELENNKLPAQWPPPSRKEKPEKMKSPGCMAGDILDFYHKMTELSLCLFSMYGVWGQSKMLVLLSSFSEL